MACGGLSVWTAGERDKARVPPNGKFLTQSFFSHGPPQAAKQTKPTFALAPWLDMRSWKKYALRLI